MKKIVSLPVKLFIAYGVLLTLALVAIVMILQSIFSYRIEDEIYFRIHNGGKTAMNYIAGDLLRLENSLQRLGDAPQPVPDPADNNRAGFYEKFCNTEKIDLLCFQPKASEAPSMQCGDFDKNLCKMNPQAAGQIKRLQFGAENYDGLTFLESELYFDRVDGYWKAGVLFSKKYIDNLRNLSGMEIMFLPRKPQARAISTLNPAKMPFQTFTDLPLEAQQLIDSFMVYSFKWNKHHEPYQFIFYPLINPQDEVIGTLGVGFSLRSIKNANRYAYNLTILFIISILATFLALGITMAHHFLQPLHDLKNTVIRLLGKRADKSLIETKDEVHFLGESFKQITEQLTSSITLLAKAKEAEKQAQRETLFRLAIAAEYKDQETGAHILRLSRYSEIIAHHLGLDEEMVEIIRDASPMHDIGKIGIPDAILQKKGALTPQEFELMKVHPKIGAGIFKNAHTPLYETCRLIALTHHEKWDGSGYPQGLRGEEIPLSGRIIAVADVFDALTSERYYKPAFGLEKSLNMMRQYTGSHFDPKVMEAFWKGLPEIEKIVGIKTQDLRWDFTS